MFLEKLYSFLVNKSFFFKQIPAFLRTLTLHDLEQSFLRTSLSSLLVPKCRCQVLLFLTDIFAISHGYSTGGISRVKCTVESDFIYRIIF